MNRNNQSFADSFFSLHCELMQATSTLLYLLQGMEAVRTSRIEMYGQSRTGQQDPQSHSAELSYTHVTIAVHSSSADHREVIRRRGQAEQLAFKGWVEQVYHIIWERNYRRELEQNLQPPGDMQGSVFPHKIPPKLDPIGDFRHIRNDFIHNGVATTRETGQCTVLKWFECGDPMILSTDHVFDFLNQMGFMVSTTARDRGGSQAKLVALQTLDDTFLDGHEKQIVSIRPYAKRNEDGTVQYLVSVVFENGVYLSKDISAMLGPTSPPDAEGFCNTTHIGTGGNVNLPDENFISRDALYQEGIDVLLGRQKSAPHLPGAWVAFF